MVLNPELTCSPNGLQILSPPKKSPEFRLIKGTPPNLNHRAIERAVWELVSEIEIGGDKVGLFNQTLKTIASATVLGGQNDFWMAEEDGEVMAYATAHFCTDIDDKLNYAIPQAWVHPKYRRNPIVREWWRRIKGRARQGLAQHLTIVSSRNPKAFARFLGGNLTTYATLMLENL